VSKKRAISRKTAQRKLDDIFSKFIRLRDADKNGICRCISCGKPIYWKELDNGHYVNRKHMSTRFNEKNCNAQCIKCNRFDEGNMLGYTKGLIKKYGEGVLDELEVLKYQTSKMSVFEMEVLIDEYNKQVKELMETKG